MSKLSFEFVKDYIENSDNNEYILLSNEYISSKTKLKILHKKCNFEYEVKYNNFQQGQRCPNCSPNKKLTYEQVKNVIESDIEYKLLSDSYVNNTTKLKILHKKCNSIFDIRFGNFLYLDQRCSLCAGNKKLTYEYVKNIIENNDEYELLSDEYVNSSTQLYIKHKRCGYKYNIAFNSFSNNGSRCKKCAGLLKLEYDYVKNEIEKTKEYELLSDEYINAHTKLKVKHNIKKCGHEYYVIFNKFKIGHRCPKCACEQTTSVGEQEVKDFLIFSGYIFSPNDRSVIYNPNTGVPLEFDMWFKELNKAIEYNGYYHSKSVQIERDRIKREQCEKLGIKLLVIEEKDWYKNKEKCKQVIKEFLS